MTEKRFTTEEEMLNHLNELYEQDLAIKKEDAVYELLHLKEEYEELLEKNEQLKEGMIRVVDRYIKNVECNPPSSVRTYMKIKGALVNIREDLRDLISDLE